MVLSRLEKVEDYARLLRTSPDEMDGQGLAAVGLSGLGAPIRCPRHGLPMRAARCSTRWPGTNRVRRPISLTRGIV